MTKSVQYSPGLVGRSREFPAHAMSGTIFPGQSFASPEKGSRPDGNLDISTPNKHQLPDESDRVSSPHNTLRLDSRPTTPTQGTGPIGGAASEGLDSEAMGGGIGLSLDPLFNAGNIQLPPFPTGQPAGSASDDEGRVSAAGPQRLLKGARVCCFRFDAWARPADPTTTADDIKRHDAHVVVVRIRLIMDRLQLLHEGRSSAGIRVTRPPTYFFDPAGAAGWLVLSASSTSLKKWQCVGAGLGCDEVLPISQPRYTTPGVHGYETIGVHFGMTKEETQQIYINTLGDVLLPEVNPPPFHALPSLSASNPDNLLTMRARSTAEGEGSQAKGGGIHRALQGPSWPSSPHPALPSSALYPMLRSSILLECCSDHRAAPAVHDEAQRWSSTDGQAFDLPVGPGHAGPPDPIG